jgi:hypothetical protein
VGAEGIPQVMPEPIRLIYTGWLPSINAHQVHWRYRQRLKRLARVQFGELPPSAWATQFAQVQVTRVLGKRQRLMDLDNLSWMLKPIIDSLKPSYIIDDHVKYADFRYSQDSSRRHEGPRIEIRICYVPVVSIEESLLFTCAYGSIGPSH